MCDKIMGIAFTVKIITGGAGLNILLDKKTLIRYSRGGSGPFEGEAMVDSIEKAVISHIQGDLPVQPRPFARMAQAVGITEEEFISHVRRLKEKGIIRRFGATLRHQEAGFSANAMVAWEIPEHEIDKTGRILSEHKSVSHCYYRAPQRDWPYSLYTMIHGSSRDECRRIAAQLSQAVDITAYALLFSEKEFKKTSMEYF